jgi:hypothetical protein
VGWGQSVRCFGLDAGALELLIGGRFLIEQ